MGIVLPLIGFIILVLIIYALIDAYPKYKLDIPSPPSLPIIGHLHKVIGLDTEQQLKLAQQYSSNTNKMMKFWFFNVLAIAPSTPELFQKILSAEECMEKPFIAYRLLTLNNGLLASRFHRWQRDRKFFNNSFKMSTLQSFLPIFNEAADRIVDDMRDNVNCNAFNISPYIFKCTLKMICSTSLGMKINNVENDEAFDKIYHAVNYVIESIASLQNKPVVYPETIYLLTPRAWKHIASAWFLRNFHYKIMSERREVLDSKDNNNSHDEDSPYYDIFIDQLLKNKNLFTDREIWEHILTILAAGYETSATCLSHCMLFIAMFQDVQQKMVDEIDEIFPNGNEEITLDRLGKLQYMERVIKETLRIAPVGPVIFRETRKEFEIEPGLVIPKGVIFILHIYCLHRSKKYWGERAEEFDPDNFLPERVAQRHPATFIPFSFGKRNCIGTRYAMLSMKTILLKFLQRYKVTTELKYNELRFKSTLTLQLIGKHLVQITERKRHEE
ncbi:cytochrome P450 4c21-like [Chironomus tepperi]|uniref:cytochrome P450 4c21-like n=1 Tax=Chironomus tepperi TaxID=113505 RepID=UPI00391FBFE9